MIYKPRLEASCHSLALAPVALRAAALFLGLLTLRDEVHLLPKRFGNPLCYNALVKASNKLLDGFAFSSVYMHSI